MINGCRTLRFGAAAVPVVFALLVGAFGQFNDERRRGDLVPIVLPGGSVVDWVGPSKGMGRPRRGGGWNDGAGDCRAACRVGETPTYTRKDFGFRLALAPAP